MRKLEAMKAVYSYFFPEVRPSMHFGERLPDEIFLTTTSAEKASEELSKLFETPFEVTKNNEGKIDLDMIHEPVIDRVVKAYSKIAPTLGNFESRYPTPGTSQGIFNVLSSLKAKGIDEIYVLKGEYEGYGEYGKNLGIKAREIDPINDDLEKLEKGYWFVSNPSARDGNIIPNEFIEELCDNGHKVALDLAYAGSTEPYEFNLGNENVEKIFLSFSKPYGIFRFRIGFTFSREPVDSLYANKWFKDVPRLMTAAKLVEKVPPGSLVKKYKPVQREIVKEINDEFGFGMIPSDAILLGYLPAGRANDLSKEKVELISNFRRGDNYRFCLTPYFEKMVG